MALFRHLLWYFRAQWWRYCIAMGVLAAVALLNLLPPWLTGKVVDAASNGSLSRDGLLDDALTIVVVAGGVYALRYLWRVSLYSASYQLGAILRERIYGHWLRQPPAFFQRFNTGDLMARATNDVTAVEMSAGEAVLALFDGVFTGLVILAMLFWVIDWRLTLLALLPWPFMAYAMYRINDELHEAFLKAQGCFSVMNERVQENISAIRLIKAYGLEPRAQADFGQAINAASAANLAVSRAEAKYDPVIVLTVASSFLLSIAGGSYLIVRNQLTVGELTSFTLYLGYLVWPMFAYGWLLNLLERGSAAYERIQAMLATEPAIKDEGRFICPANPELALDIQAFTYPGSDQIVLHDLHVRLAPGRTLGIVGPTGAGKSTLVKLLGRLYEHEGVTIRLDQHRLQHYRLESLRATVSIVPQEAFLFSASIAQNIALGKPGASPGEIEAAARLASIHEDILRFPEGYQTQVGERGLTLSGGQKQRLALARALLMDAPILVLDDALSAVDVGTEQQILRYLRQHRGGRTTIIVCHRLTAVEHADDILVLQQGRIRERGDHAGLLAGQGWYERMYRYQQLEQVVEAGH